MSRKTQRQLADEAYERTAPGPTMHQLGQLDIDGTVEGAPMAGSVPKDIPDTCPECGRAMTLAHGWTLLRVVCAVQCGFCAKVVHVSQNAYLDLKAQLARWKAAVDVKPPKEPKRGKRTRGAG